MELASTTGKGRKMTELTIAKRTTFAAMQTEKVSSTVATKPLSRHKERNPYFRLRRNASINLGSLRECPQGGLVARSRYAGTRDKVPSRGVPSADLSPGPLCSLPHTFGNVYALYAMKRDGHARASKIDADALLDK